VNENASRSKLTTTSASAIPTSNGSGIEKY
jgi:hypothetical protein